ncbi:hypothetical protein IU424_32235 [Nocardia brasiliensis]|nr:hypothetical protein [Nocardia brasiliensis]
MKLQGCVDGHDRGIIVRIARKGIESSERLGRNRWVIERTSSWLTGCHQLNIRYDHKGVHVCAFLLWPPRSHASKN